MTPEQAAEHLRVIRQLMERPVRHTTRSGLAGLVAGGLALAGAALTWHLLPPEAEWPLLNPARPYRPPAGAVWNVALVWLAVLLAAAAGDVLITWRRARRRQETWWKREQLQTAMAIVPGFVLAAFFTYIWYILEFNYIPFGWMIGYGMALWTVGMFSITEVKVLGAAFLASGWAGLILLSDYPVAAMAVTFGGFHLVYGLVVLKRHGG
jgi:hypothetical protein